MQVAPSASAARMEVSMVMRPMLAVLLLAVAGWASAPRAQEPAPAGAAYGFPPEWAPHEAVWLGWADNSRQHRVQVEMIRAMAPHVRIRLMVTSDRARAQAAAVLQAAGVERERVEFLTHEVPNFWIRDAGPRFLSDGRRLAVADFAWAAYGYPRELLVGAPDLLRRGAVGRDLAARLSLPVVSSAVVAEGGALEMSDTVILAYRSTALQRNPGVPLEEIEREYLRVHRKQKVVWLDRSPLSDRVFSGPKLKNYFGAGANGHIDEYIRFVNDSTIVIAQVDPQEAVGNPISQADHAILRENFAQLKAAADVNGQPFRVITLPVPALRHHLWTGPLTDAQKRRDALDAWYRDFSVGDEIHWVPALSYLNFFVTNGIVLVPAYWREGLPEREREKDTLVRETLQRLFPDRRVVQINPLEVNRIGGGMHCITQQQPRVE
jgi:agmatine deiminase